MPAANSFIVILALLIAQVLFGVHYIASKVLLAEFPPMVWACLRSVSSATVFLLVCLAMRKLQPRRVLRNLWPLLLFALLSTGLNQALFLSGLQHTTPTNSALLNTLIPVVTLFFVVLTGREKIDARLSVGFMVALIGVLVLMGFESLDFSSETFYGDVLTILNVVY